MKTRKKLFFAAVLALGLWALCGSAWAVEDMISYWRFDEGGGTIAYDSVGTNDGTIYGAAWTTGQVGGALSFDGIDDCVTLPDNEPIWLPQYNFTLSAWLYFERAPGSSGEKILDLNHASSANPDYDQGYGVNRSSTGQIGFEINTTTTPDEVLVTDDMFFDGKWYHIVAVRDGTTQAIYVDGQLNVSRTCSPDPIDFVGGYDDDRVNIGRLTTNVGTPRFHFKGKIDDVRIYDRALSAAEILVLYQQGSGPVAHWKFDEGNGSIAHDSAGSNHGTVYGATWTTGQINGALSFQRVGDYVEVSDSPILNTTNQITLSAWINENSVGIWRFAKIISKGADYYTPHYELYSGSSQNKYAFIVHTGSVEHVVSNVDAMTGWVHLVGTYDGSEMKIYINGSLDNVKALTGPISTANNPLYIGKRQNDYERYFNGIIDDVRIYERDLSPEEIQELYAPYFPGENLVVNGGFDTTEITSGGWPSTYGDWSGDHSYIFARYGDVWPFQGSQMLQFVGTAHTGASSDDTCQVYQIIDVSQYADIIAAGQGIVLASAYFNRAEGDAQTDTEFVLTVHAHEGDPCSFVPWELVLDWVETSVYTDSNPATWEQGETQLVLPTNTDYVVIGIIAMENIYNDFSWPEFDGHFADAVSLRIMVEPKVPERVYYVDGINGDDNNDGLSPETAFATIQKGIDMAVGGDVVTVADGAYTGLGNKNLDFAGRAITVRSENGPEFTIIDCENDGRGFYFHTGEDENAVVDGFTITNGSADYGAGIRCDNSSPTINNCIFTSNSAEILGGGIHAGSSSPVVTNCTFEENRAGEHAGGMCCTHSNALVSGCVFIANSCYNYSADGGAMWNAGETSATIVNCLFVGNTAPESGGAIRNDRSSPTIINCTFAENSATHGGAVHNAPYSSPTITNCILWGNTAPSGDEIDNNGDCHPTISYCDIEGGWNGPKVVNRSGSSVIDGGGNIDDVPCFADPNSGDYHLKSQAGRWDPNSQSWVQDDVTSLCIDAGAPMSPIGYEPFPNGGIINMGACGGTAEASKSYFGQPVCEVVVAGDINGDCKVNFLDFRLMTLHWLEDNTSPSN